MIVGPEAEVTGNSLLHTILASFPRPRLPSFRNTPHGPGESEHSRSAE
jgi:hypothetical protein